MLNFSEAYDLPSAGPCDDVLGRGVHLNGFLSLSPSADRERSHARESSFAPAQTSNVDSCPIVVKGVDTKDYITLKHNSANIDMSVSP